MQPPAAPTGRSSWSCRLTLCHLWKLQAAISGGNNNKSGRPFPPSRQFSTTHHPTYAPLDPHRDNSTPHLSTRIRFSPYFYALPTSRSPDFQPLNRISHHARRQGKVFWRQELRRQDQRRWKQEAAKPLGSRRSSGEFDETTPGLEMRSRGSGRWFSIDLSTAALGGLFGVASSSRRPIRRLGSASPGLETVARHRDDNSSTCQLFNSNAPTHLSLLAVSSGVATVPTSIGCRQVC